MLGHAFRVLRFDRRRHVVEQRDPVVRRCGIVLSASIDVGGVICGDHEECLIEPWLRARRGEELPQRIVSVFQGLVDRQRTTREPRGVLRFQFVGMVR